MTDNSVQNETLSPVEGTAQPEQSEVSVTSEAPGSLDALHPKQELRGTVKRIELFGAFVDVGVGKDGLLHISQLGDQPVKNVNDLLKEGDEITVWVRKVDTVKGMFDLTMIKPLGLDWSEIQNGQVYTGTVVRVEKFGAFIDIGAERPGMVHVSELSTGYISSPDEKVKVGDSIQVKVIKVNSRKKQIDLSVKALEQAAVSAARAEVEEDDDKVPTALELALRRAMVGSEETFPELTRAIQNIDANKDVRSNKGKQGKKDKRSGSDKRRQQQEEILSRTLGTREPARDRSSAN